MPEWEDGDWCFELKELLTDWVKKPVTAIKN